MIISLLYYFVSVVSYFEWFLNVKTTLHSFKCIPIDHAISYICIFGFNLLIFCHRFLYLCSWGILVFNFIFCTCLFGFDIKVMVILYKELSNISFPSIIWKSLCKLVLILPRIFNRSFERNHNETTIFFEGGFR